MFEGAEKREADKRKRERNMDAGDVEGYLGPWGKFVDEKTVMKPSEVGFLSFYARFKRNIQTGFAHRDLTHTSEYIFCKLKVMHETILEIIFYNNPFKRLFMTEYFSFFSIFCS